MPPETLSVRLRSEARAIGVVLTEQHAGRLSRYLELVARWRRRAGLTAVTDPFEAARLHIADSLLILRAEIQRGSSLIDVGSGAGLPGIPLAVVRPDLNVTLLEADHRKAGFLELAASELVLSVGVVARRAEEFAHDLAARERYDVVVARAVAPLSPLLELTLPFTRIGGVVALLKGPAVQREILAADRAMAVLGGGEVVQMKCALAGGEDRRLVMVRKVSVTPVRYPRRAGVPSRSPL